MRPCYAFRLDQTLTPRPTMPRVITHSGASIALGKETRRLRLAPVSPTTALDMAPAEAQEVWLDHARGTDYLGLISTRLAPKVLAAFEDALRQADESDTALELAAVCALAESRP